MPTRQNALWVSDHEPFRVERLRDGGERIVVPARRAPFRLALCIVMAISLFAAGVLAISLGGRLHVETKLLLLVSATTLIVDMPTLFWLANGSQALQVNGDCLEISTFMLGLRRRRRYPLAYVRKLSANEAVRRYTDNPLMWSPISLAVKFVYGSIWVYAAPGLNASQGAEIADWLTGRLPREVVDGVANSAT